MCIIESSPKLVLASDTVATVKRLSELRQIFEKEGGKPQERVMFALLLADVCEALALSEADQRKVLGRRALRFIKKWGDIPVKLVDETRSALVEANAL